MLSSSTVVLDNPFPLEAVSTYGRPLITSESLSMQAPRDQLDQYLRAYPRSDQRYGGAIGIRGGHGSGKTHLLGWLGARARSRDQIQPVVLYGKINSSSLFDLYRQIAKQISRERFIELIAIATRNIAFGVAGRAAATEGIRPRIPAEFTELVQEKNIDLGFVRLQLEAHLLQPEIISPRPGETDVPTKAIADAEWGTFARTLLKMGDAVGDAAYSWVTGGTVIDVGAIGVAGPLQQDGGANAASNDDLAVRALETIAALHRIAEVPFVVLIDQLEVLLRADDARREVMFSVIKKLIEQVGRQNALVFLAGVDEAWDALPRDVPARLRTRSAIRVGALTESEIKVLLLAYSGEAALSPEALVAICELSGGSPREVLRISHQVFAATDGAMDAATPDVVLRAADEAGSVADRQVLALQLVDRALTSEGAVSSDIGVDENVRIDRLLSLDGTPRLAVVVVAATDEISEVSSARKVSAVKRYITDTWPDTTLVVVSVGYSTRGIRTLLSDAATVVKFDEQHFAAELKRHVLEAVARQPAARTATVPDVAAALANFAAKLDKLEFERNHANAARYTSFDQGITLLHEPQSRQREIRSRWELGDALNDLAAALSAGDGRGEHEIMRAVLVANEALHRIARIDSLGQSYLDALDLAYGARSPDMELDLGLIRRDLIEAMRRALRKRPLDLFGRSDIELATVLAFLLLFAASFIPAVRGSLPGFGLTSWFVAVTFFSALLAALVGASLIYWRSWRNGRWDRAINAVRRSGRIRSAVAE